MLLETISPSLRERVKEALRDRSRWLAFRDERAAMELAAAVHEYLESGASNLRPEHPDLEAVLSGSGNSSLTLSRLVELFDSLGLVLEFRLIARKFAAGAVEEALEKDTLVPADPTWRGSQHDI